MSKRGEVAYKIVGGFKLTIQEFRIAVETGMLNGTKPTTEEELVKAYLYWVSSYYEDSKRRGYLCSSYPTRKIRDLENGGEEFCGWGIHLDEVNTDSLTPSNVKFLRHHFGKDKVKELIRK